MKKPQLTVPLAQSINTYLQTLDETKASAAKTLIDVFESATNEKALLWRGDMIGFGQYHYRYASGHEGDAMRCGFAMRKSNITLYLMSEAYLYPEREDVLLNELGPFTNGKSCIYFKKVSDIRLDVLEKLIHRSNALLKELYDN